MMSLFLFWLVSVILLLLTTPPLKNPPFPQGGKLDEAHPNFPKLYPRVQDRAIAPRPGGSEDLWSYPIWRREWIVVPIRGCYLQHLGVEGLNLEQEDHGEGKARNNETHDESSNFPATGSNGHLPNVFNDFEGSIVAFWKFVLWCSCNRCLPIGAEFNVNPTPDMKCHNPSFVINLFLHIILSFDEVAKKWFM